MTNRQQPHNSGLGSRAPIDQQPVGNQRDGQMTEIPPIEAANLQLVSISGTSGIVAECDLIIPGWEVTFYAMALRLSENGREEIVFPRVDVSAPGGSPYYTDLRRFLDASVGLISAT
jgi:hypothetical protein